MKIRLTKTAEKRLNEIYRFLLKKSEQAASKVCLDILDEINLLADFPEMAAIDPTLYESAFTYRSLIVRHTYKVIYYIDGEVIVVSTIWDCRQNPGKLKKILSS